MAASILLWTVSLLAGLATAIPAATFPINSQVPPVARIGEPFSFVFSASTFSPSAQLTYTLAQSPDWLSIDSSERQLYGTPSEEDIGAGDVVGVPFQVRASDGSGSAAMSVTLVVSRQPAPVLEIALADQNLDFAPISQPSSFIMRPDETFAFSLAADTFSHLSGQGLTYYAVMADHSPLPAWVDFDPSALSFSGTTPSLAALVQTPQAFDFQLIASDVVGFSGASLPFSLVVGNHRITTADSEVSLNATVGKRMSYTGLARDVKLDGNNASSASLVLSTSGTPSWVSVDEKTWEISGTPTKADESATFTITMSDQFLDTLNLTVSVNITDGLFTGSLPQLNLTAGEQLDFDLKPYLADSSDLEVRIESEPAAAWLEFDDSSKVISGHVPASDTDSTITITVHAESASSGEERSEPLVALIRSAAAQTTSTASQDTLTTATAASPTSTTEPSLQGKDVEGSSSRATVLAIVLPIVLVALIMCILAFCYRRRRKGQTPADRREISYPIPGSFKNKGDTGPGAAVQSLGTIREMDYSPHSSEFTPDRDPYGQALGRLLTPPPSRDGQKGVGSSGMRLVKPSWSMTTPVTPTRPMRNVRRISDGSYHDSSPESLQSYSNVLSVDIPHFTMFSVQHTPDSAYFTSPNFTSPDCTADLHSDDSGRTTSLEDLMEEFMYSPESRPESAEPGGQQPRLPPLADLGARPRPLFPRRLFADTRPAKSTLRATATSPPESSAGGGHPPGSSSYSGTPDATLFHPLSSNQTWTTVSHGDDKGEERYSVALMTPARWPVPPPARPRLQVEPLSIPARAHIRVVPVEPEIDDRIGIATSRYSSSLDHYGTLGSEGDFVSEEGGRSHRSHGGRTAGSGSGSDGSYSVYI